MIPTAEKLSRETALAETAVPVFIYMQNSGPSLLDLGHIVELVVLLFDHHTVFVHAFVFHHFCRADAVHVLDQPADLSARPRNHVF